MKLKSVSTALDVFSSKSRYFLRNFRLLTRIFSRKTWPIYNPRPVLNSVKPALSNEIKFITWFSISSLVENFWNFFCQKFFWHPLIIIKLLYILNFDENPQYYQTRWPGPPYFIQSNFFRVIINIEPKPDRWPTRPVQLMSGRLKS